MTSNGSSPLTPDTKPAQTILIVDDTPQNLTILGELLQPYYRVRAANSGERALRAAGLQPTPDLILLDVMMPGMDGYAVLERLRADPATRNIPVIFVTAMHGVESEEHGLELGAVDYITKPINPAIVLARVRTHLELKQARDRLALENEWLEGEVTRRMRENLLIQDLSVRALACLSEARDNETGLHIVRTQTYVELLARRLAEHPRFCEALAGDRLGMIVKAAPLHDLGKVGIPDGILLKPGKLTDEEFEIMKHHATIGADAIGKAMAQASASAGVEAVQSASRAFLFLGVAQEIASGHHEKWDGSGYPEGLRGEDIPLEARIVAVADVFDALTSVRPYKSAWPVDKAVNLLLEEKGRHFDPALVDAFVASLPAICAIKEQFAESQAGSPAPA
jgi:putative two-component system response regulator